MSESQRRKIANDFASSWVAAYQTSAGAADAASMIQSSPLAENGAVINMNVTVQPSTTQSTGGGAPPAFDPAAYGLMSNDAAKPNPAPGAVTPTNPRDAMFGAGPM